LAVQKTPGQIFPAAQVPGIRSLWFFYVLKYSEGNQEDVYMKVEGPGQAQGTSKSKKSGKADRAGNIFGSMISSGPQETGATKTTQSIAMVDSLLAVQGAEDPTARAARRRMRQRSETVLNELEKIRMAMLGGNLTIGHMIDIADVVASHREKVNDPALSALMDEIDLRAQVELAKIRVALDAQK
jgi:hypothetical protein